MNQHQKINFYSQGLTAETFKAIRYPVEDFLQAQNLSVVPETCKESDTFAYLLNQLVDHRYHRSWVIDTAGFPIGVISLTDVCATLQKAALNI